MEQHVRHTGMHRFARVVLTALLTLAGGVAASGIAIASCAPPAPSEQLARADVIVYATLASTRMTLSFPPSNVHVFNVREVYKGDAPRTIEVRTGPPTGATSVDYRADAGDHVLYLRRDGSRFVTDACSGSHAGPPTPEEMKVFGTGRVASEVAAAADAQIGIVLVAGLLALGVFAGLIIARRRSRSAP